MIATRMEMVFSKELNLLQVRSKAKYDTNNDGKIEQDEMLDVMSPPESRH